MSEVPLYGLRRLLRRLLVAMVCQVVKWVSLSCRVFIAHKFYIVS